MCITQVEWVLEWKIFKDSGNGMKGPASANPNALTKMKYKVRVKRADILRYSREAATQAITINAPVDSKITTNTDTQDEADR